MTEKEHIYFILEYLKGRHRYNDIVSIAEHFGLGFEECKHLCEKMEGDDLVSLSRNRNEIKASITVLGKEFLDNPSKIDKLYGEDDSQDDNTIVPNSDPPKGTYQIVIIVIGILGLIVSIFKC